MHVRLLGETAKIRSVFSRLQLANLRHGRWDTRKKRGLALQLMKICEMRNNMEQHVHDCFKISDPVFPWYFFRSPFLGVNFMVAPRWSEKLHRIPGVNQGDHWHINCSSQLKDGTFLNMSNKTTNRFFANFQRYWMKNLGCQVEFSAVSSDISPPWVETAPFTHHPRKVYHMS